MSFLHDLKHKMRLHDLAKTSIRRNLRRQPPVVPKKSKTKVEYRERLIIKVQKEFINNLNSEIENLKHGDAPFRYNSQNIFLDLVRKVQEATE
jgi:hypothetical protein